MANKPNIRFKGFTEEWRNSAFGIEVTSMTYKKYVKSPEPLGMYPIIQQGDNPICGYANGEPILDYEDKIIFGDHTTSVYKPITPFFAATDGIRIFSIKGLPPFFTYSLFERYKPKSIGYARHTLQLLETRISIPVEQKEAENIGDYFKKLNSTITQREKELEKLKNIKRALLEKLFPQNGEKVPALRFKEFAEEWEEIIMGQVIKEVNRKDSNSMAPIMMIAAGSGFIYQSDRYSFNNAGKSLQQYTVLSRRELAYNHGASKVHPYGCCYALLAEDSARVPYVYHCFSTSCDPEFLSTLLNGKEVEGQLRKLISSGARMDGLLNISFEAYSSISLVMPKSTEQKKIAKLVYSINHLLSLREKQLTLLKHTKQALLEQMFVNE